MINLSVTETEYLLKIPFSEKERAKKIQGRRWDPERTCWVYPKNVEIYNQLIAEFAEDLKVKTQPNQLMGSGLRSEVPQSAQKEDKTSSESNTLDEVNPNSANESSFDQSELILELNRKINIQSEQIKKMDEKEIELSELKRKYNYLLEKQYKQDLDNSTIKTEDIEKILKDFALNATHDNASYKSLLDSLPLDNQFVIEFTVQLEMKLRQLLNNFDKSVPLYEIIKQVDEKEAINPDGIELAHLIRRERNKFAHAHLSGLTKRAHTLMCLFASALLWLELPE